ncbi:hypothetical protein [Rouxiella chamberiensis]|uniref:Uncharacterized protein n=1 Tax=Rouxiella chamberiensis TaxID=1513468 RepID=A0ABY7HQ71_9GAMM|nr:hypothetical protein [Rouxiella chamberiensis]WAT01001.1 hypothetical protein O1V66_19875 [Rouxiella chamberiensis]
MEKEFAVDTSCLGACLSASGFLPIRKSSISQRVAEFSTSSSRLQSLKPGDEIRYRLRQYLICADPMAQNFSVPDTTTIQGRLSFPSSRTQVRCSKAKSMGCDDAGNGHS